jgi:hypothetical protein
VHLRCKQRLGPAQIAPQVGLAASTVHAVLVRCRISRLACMDRATGQPVRRYDHAHPGALLHVDVKQLGNIPAGGGHRFVGRSVGKRHRNADRSSGRVNRYSQPLRGHAFVHAAVDDHSRLAYAEIQALVILAAPDLVTLCGVGVELAGQFLVTAGDNAERIQSEAALAKLCGVAHNQPAAAAPPAGTASAVAATE